MSLGTVRFTGEDSFSRIEILYLLTSEQALLQVCVPSAQISDGSVKLPTNSAEAFSVVPVSWRGARIDGASRLHLFLPGWRPPWLRYKPENRLQNHRRISDEPFSVSAYRTLVRESSNHLGELDSCHDVHFFLLENGVG